MRFSRSILVAAGLVAGLAMTAPAIAGQVKERIYGDSFGNLIIYSPAGYKSIVVGRGYLAEELAAADAGNERAMVYADEGPVAGHARHCYYKPYFWQGRSRMYGLPEGVVPTPPRICR